MTTGLRRWLPLFVPSALLIWPPASMAQISLIGTALEERNATPGLRYRGVVHLRNQSADSQAVRIYQTDYRFFADGTSYFDSAGVTPRSNANWIKLADTLLVIPPAGEAKLGYSVSVPKRRSLRGTYWSIIMLESAASAEPLASRQQVNVGTVLRHAVQIATHLPARTPRTIAFTNQTRTIDSTGHRVVELDVQNTSERGYRPLLRALIYDAAGVLRGRYEAQRGLIYPGTSIRQRLDIGTLPAGRYRAVVSARVGDVWLLRREYRLDFP